MRNNDIALVDRLIRAGADVKATNRYGISAIALACESGSAPIVERLIAAGVSANATGPYGETALHTCAHAGKVEAAKVLIARGFVVLFGIVAYILALSADSVYGLVEEASSFGSAGIFVVAVAALFVPIGGRASAFCAILTGLGVWTLAAYALPALEFDAGLVTEYPYLTSLAAALVAYVFPAVARARSGGPNL